MKFETKTKSLNYGIDFTHGIRRALMSALALIYFLSFGFSVVSITTLFILAYTLQFSVRVNGVNSSKTFNSPEIKQLVSYMEKELK